MGTPVPPVSYACLPNSAAVRAPAATFDSIHERTGRLLLAASVQWGECRKWGVGSGICIPQPAQHKSRLWVGPRRPCDAVLSSFGTLLGPFFSLFSGAAAHRLPKAVTMTAHLLCAASRSATHAALLHRLSQVHTGCAPVVLEAPPVGGASWRHELCVALLACNLSRTSCQAACCTGHPSSPVHSRRPALCVVPAVGAGSGTRGAGCWRHKRGGDGGV